MKQYRFALTGLAAFAALALACGRQSSSPTSPSSTAAGTAAAAAGVTLKATAPTPLSPLNDARLEAAPTLSVSPASMLFSDRSGELQYRFQVLNDAGALVVDSGLVVGTTYAVSTELDFEQRYTWRCRAELEGHFGPWGAAGSFITAAGAYLRGNELRDPLTNGQTLGTAVGSTFIPGVGVRLDGRSSYVEWQLQLPLDAGEFSAVMTNIGNGSEEWKTKVMSMLQGDGVNITDNLYRATVDKRTTWGSQGSRVRYTIRSGGNDSPEPAGGPQNWSRAKTYFWKFEWGGGTSRLRVYEGGVGGVKIEDLSANTKGVYRPTPHLIRLGSVGGRGGDDTNPGTTVRNVWVSARPRPAFSGDN
jgi:hypothetical protein